MLLILTIWFICVLANILLCLKATAMEQTDSGKIGDLTYKQAYDEFGDLGDTWGVFILFGLVLSPIGTIFILIFLSADALKKFVNDNPDRKLSDK